MQSIITRTREKLGSIWNRISKKQPIAEAFNQSQIRDRRQWTDENLIEDVRYAIQVGTGYLRWLPAEMRAIEGKVVMEIGPGLNFGSTLYLACLGARVIVVDPYIALWDNDYHPRFYTLMCDYIQQEFPSIDITPLNRILKANSYLRSIIHPIGASLEDLRGVLNSSVDIVFSNAVLEHLRDPLQAFNSLARVSKSGAFGLHQVDFRDHANMDRPLEFLLINDREFAQISDQGNFERGNRWRPKEYQELFQITGFEVFDTFIGQEVKPAYFEDFIPRLRSANGSKYQHFNEDALKITSLLIKVRKVVDYR